LLGHIPLGPQGRRNPALADREAYVVSLAAPVRNGEWGQHTRHVVSQHHCRPGLAVAGWSV